MSTSESERSGPTRSARDAVPTPALWPGRPYPLGATWDGRGTSFAVFSEHAEAVELCLSAEGDEQRVELKECTGFVWHGYLLGVGPGQRYGFRVHGPWEPARGHRFNASKLLLDPYAKAIDGDVTWDPACFGHVLGQSHTARDDRDSAPYVPRSVVINPFFDWRDDHPPRRPWSETVIYETHVKGLTKRHPAVAEELRGTYAGLADPVVLDYLVDLGVTAVELQPVHHFIHDHFLHEKGLRQYWGYNTLGFLAPHAGYAARGVLGAQVYEFKAMVADLHAAGLEVILDVVYNHTGESDEKGPTLNFRGLDNVSYYRLRPEDPSRYVDYTGTGNSLNVRNPHVLQLIMDSLRYWVTEMHVDGFRFDLASTLARELHDVDRLAAFFDVIQQDPVISQVKLIAEPWDVGEGGYQVGNFPVLWTEWNGQYRDTVRDYWRGAGRLGPMALRLSGSADLYEDDGRQPYASINFVTAHDGFTLRDLVSYERKHNAANLDGGTSGEDHNRSWNCGAEGPTDDLGINALRARQQRNVLATLFISQGVPMLLGGDEFGRTQQGNNNAYCQDNALSWYDWDWTAEQRELVDFTCRLAAIRQRHPVLRRRTFFTGDADLHWLTADGEPMTEQDWNADFARAVGFFLNGEAIASTDDRGRPLRDDSFLVLLNAADNGVIFTLPDRTYGRSWATVLDTGRPDLAEGSERLGADATRLVEHHALVLMRREDAARA